MFCIRNMERSSKDTINHLIDNGAPLGMVKDFSWLAKADGVS